MAIETIKSIKTTNANPQQPQQHHLFVSYELNDEIIVKNFVNNLRKQLNIEIWLDREKLNSSRSVGEQIREGIDESEMFLCFINRLYSLSSDCVDEILYAKSEKKRIIVVMLEYANVDEFGEIGSVINGRLRINAYKEISAFKEGMGDEYKKLVKSLMNALDISLKIENESRKAVKKNAKQDKLEKVDCYFSPLMKGFYFLHIFGIFIKIKINSILASLFGRLDLIKYLIKQGANVDEINEKGMCALHMGNCKAFLHSFFSQGYQQLFLF